MNRRNFLKVSGTAGLLAACRSSPAQPFGPPHADGVIDRRRVVRRHNPDFHGFDPYAALSVGNGEFAFTGDLTGLQTFTEECEEKFPLCTAAHWAWHSFPEPAEIQGTELRPKFYDAHGRAVPYFTDSTGQQRLFNFLRDNPHKLHLGRIGLEFGSAGEAPIRAGDITAPHQTLDLWTGVNDSRFSYAGQPVRVRTCVHPLIDAIAIRVESPLLAAGRLRVRIAFPYASPNRNMADWTHPDRHVTRVEHATPRSVHLQRTLDATQYFVSLSLANGTELAERGPHEFLLDSRGTTVEFTCHFAQNLRREPLPDFDATSASSAAHWEKFWTEGGFIDFGDCTDPRAEELERRTILSLYNTALHCSGSLPPAETGLLCNSWSGKFHLEMHWWHGVHFASWNRFSLFERSLGYYAHILPAARELARSQGYRGCRWPKMTDATGRDSPSSVGPLLIWQQPHPIYYAELAYQASPTRRTLEQWRDIVFDSATFMADYAVFNPARNGFVLGPPLKTVPENTDPLRAHNPAFELAYWRFGLRMAQTWRQRLGLAPEPHWARVLAQLAPLPVADGLYLLEEDQVETYTKWNWEHPSHLGAFGMQPGDGVDASIMRASLRRTMEVWKWDTCWGWDFPMTACCAARAGEPEAAVQALLLKSPKNLYHPNGHNYQTPTLTSYLPGNGGFLSAIGMMAAGWTGGPRGLAPGFPSDGRWSVRAEALRPWL